MAEPTIKNGEEHFWTNLYEGNGAGQRVGKFVPFTDNGTIANSVIYNRADNPRLAITPSSAGNRRTWTFSAWIKRTILGSPRHQILNVSPSDGASGDFLYFDTNNTIKFTDATSSNYTLITNRTFEDTSKFYHLLISADSTQSTAANRLKIYIDGEQITSFSTETYMAQDYQFEVNNNSLVMNLFGDFGSSNTENGDGYFAEVNMVDGTALTPSTFGLTDTSTGRWIPKTLTGITYGTNGFRLKFQDSSALGDDTSGNGNDLTAANLASTDQTTDSPTQNFATGTATADSGNVVPHTISEGNLAFSNPSGTSGRGVSTAKSTLRLDPKSDTGYYCEIKCDTTAGGNGVAVGITDVRADGVAPNTSTYTSSIGNNFILATDGYYSRDVNGSNANATDTSTFPTYTTGDTLGLAFKEGKLWIAKNNTWYNSGNPSTGANPIIQFSNETLYRFALYLYGVNAGSGNKGTFNFGQRAFRYTPPTDFVAVQQDNLPETGKGVSGLSWIKDRDSASYSHFLFDSSRGQGNALKSNSTNGQSSYNPNELQKFLKGGYSVGSSTEVNRATSYAAWNWVANSGSTSSNTEGSITSTVQANTTAGFIIIEATAAASGIFTLGHGLSSPPEYFLVKDDRNCW